MTLRTSLSPSASILYEGSAPPRMNSTSCKSMTPHNLSHQPYTDYSSDRDIQVRELVLVRDDHLANLLDGILGPF